MTNLTTKIKSLFAAEDIAVTPIDPGRENTNDIFEVESKEGSCIIKIPKVIRDPHNTFWSGLKQLFGLNIIVSINSQKLLSKYIRHYGIITVPRVLQADGSNNNVLGRPFVILEKMYGEPIIHNGDIEQQIKQDKDFMYQLGTHLGALHAKKLEYFGTLKHNKQLLADFPEKLAATISRLAKFRKAQQDPDLQAMLPIYLQQAREMDIPEHCGVIMPDLWLNQFLVDLDQKQLSACIDIEACVVGPVDLELSLIELWLGNLGKFKEGYFSVNKHWPAEIEQNRLLYRYFLFLLYGCPEAGLDACMYSRAKFPQGDRVKARISAPRLRPPGYPQIN
jgi:Ser/Thr protein kinase RdoA (MazF antagonist)